MIGKRKLTAIVLVLVVLAGITMTAYLIKNDIFSTSNPGARYGCDASGYCVGVDPNKHIGVINVLSKDTIQEQFGSQATVGEPKESGVVTGVGAANAETETVSYAVKTKKGTVEFQLDVRKYASQEDREQANVFLGAEEKKVEGVGEEAHYFVPTLQELGDQQIALFVVKGGVSYKFAIVQKPDTVVYTVDEAKPILLNIAKAADLSKV